MFRLLRPRKGTLSAIKVMEPASQKEVSPLRIHVTSKTSETYIIIIRICTVPVYV